MPKKSRSEYPTKSNMVNAPKHCSNLRDTSFAIFINHWVVNCLTKKSLLVICKISKMFPNTLSADCKYSVLDRDNLTQRTQMLLSRKQKTFSRFFSSFFKSALNLEHFKKKMTLIADVFPKLRTPKNMVR